TSPAACSRPAASDPNYTLICDERLILCTVRARAQQLRERANVLKRSLRRTLGAAAVAAALVLGSTAAAHATPTPDNGPVTGGTTVMVPEPAGVTFTSISGSAEHSVALGSDGNA